MSSSQTYKYVIIGFMWYYHTKTGGHNCISF